MTSSLLRLSNMLRSWETETSNPLFTLIIQTECVKKSSRSSDGVWVLLSERKISNLQEMCLHLPLHHHHTGSQMTEVAKLSKSSMTVLNKRVGEIPLQTVSIGAREVEMTQERILGPTVNNGAAESNCSPLRVNTPNDHQSELLNRSIWAPAATSKQHPKPLPNPNKIEVFKDSINLEIKSDVDSKMRQKIKKELAAKNDKDEENNSSRMNKFLILVLKNAGLGPGVNRMCGTPARRISKTRTYGHLMELPKDSWNLKLIYVLHQETKVKQSFEYCSLKLWPRNLMVTYTTVLSYA